MRKLSLLSAWALLLLSQNLLSGNNFGNGTSKGFIENKGQVHDQNLSSRNDVKFILPLGGMNLILKNDGFSYDTYKINAVDQSHNWEDLFTRKTPEKQSNTCSYHRVDIEFAGANINPQIIAEGKSKDYLNFYGSGLGENGVTDVRIYQKVIYKNIYPNIDVEFVNENNNAKPAEFNFVLRPGANISDIRLKYKGASSTELVKGELKLNLQHGTLTETIPLSYWQRSHKKEKISYALTREQNGEVTIAYSGLSKPITETLVIDPTPNLDWATYYGGGFDDWARAIANDQAGNVYVTGYTFSTSQIATTGAFQTIVVYPENGYIVKLNRSGVRQWGTYYAGSDGYVELQDVDCDKNGNVFVVGFCSAASMATPGAHQTTLFGISDGLLAKFNSAGMRQWATYYGGDEDPSLSLDEAKRLCCDTSGNVYITGATSSTNNIASPGAYQGNWYIGYSDGFLAKFSASGVRQWGTYFGGAFKDVPNSIAKDINENIIIAGVTTSQDSIATSGAFNTNYNGGNGDGFIIRFSPSGSRMWGSYYGGTNHDEITAVCTDLFGNIMFTGNTNSGTDIASTNAYQSSFACMFAGKFYATGQRAWGTYLGYNYASAFGISSDSSGNAYVSGAAGYNTNITTPGSYQYSVNGDYDVFIVKYDSSGSRIFGTMYGGPKDDGCSDMVVFSQNEIYIAGTTRSLNGISTPWSHQPISNVDPSNNFTAYIAKLSNTGAVGINEIEKSANINDILVYPNPNNGEFYIRTNEDKNILITNALGQIVKNVKMKQGESARLSVPDGIYILKCTSATGNKTSSQKIIVLHD